MGTGSRDSTKVAELQAEVGSLRQDLEKSKDLVKHLARKRKELEDKVSELTRELSETKRELAEFQQYMHGGED